ncbi:MAG: uroporphyrinogen decarboxylase family protein [Planctomycetota bacterium]|jgi:uroporphyrinogen-III decarboxylase|nr:uroporphyrinogen decarboxylase family protein [Planctomycetota bacterium]
MRFNNETEPSDRKWTIRERVVATFKGEQPDCPPFIDRLDIWYGTHSRAGTLPEAFREMSLNDVHRAIGFGQEQFINAYGRRLRGVEVISRFEGEVHFHEKDPVLNNFPHVFDLIPRDRGGITVTEFITPVGTVSVTHAILDEMIANSMQPYLTEHLIKEESDYRTVMYILERLEYVPRLEEFTALDASLGDSGFPVLCIGRVPFQQVLLELLGDVAMFYALHDSPDAVKTLLAILDEQTTECLHKLAEWPALYVEFVDNLHGLMTNPALFAEYSLPYYQRYAEILHAQGKKVGSHTDGNLKPLLGLLAESGLDVCESFSPDPLTECTFDEAWNAWPDGPMIWGGIPSPILEERTSQGAFEDYVGRVLQTIGDGPVILGVSDMVMGNNSIERVRYIAEQVEGTIS